MADEATATAEQESGADGGGEGESKPQPKYTEDQFQQLFKDRLGRERKRLKSELRDDLRAELLADEAFRQTALEEWEVEANGKGDKLDDKKVQELRQAWEKEAVVPLKEKTETLEEKLESLRTSQLESDLLSAAGSFVQKGLLKRQQNGRTALFNMIGGEFVFDAETDEWRVRGKDGEFRPSPGGEKLYMDPDEFVKNVWAQDPDNAAFITDTTQGGSGYEGPPKGAGGKRVYTRQEYTKLCGDPQYFAQHRDELKAAAAEGRVRG